MPMNDYETNTISNPHKAWAPTLKRHPVEQIGLSRKRRERDDAILWVLLLRREEDGRTVEIVLSEPMLDALTKSRQMIEQKVAEYAEKGCDAPWSISNHMDPRSE